MGEVGEDEVCARHVVVVVIVEVVGSTLRAQRLCEWMSKHHCCFFFSKSHSLVLTQPFTVPNQFTLTLPPRTSQTA